MAVLVWVAALRFGVDDYMRWLIEERDTDPLSDQERADLDEAEKERARGGGESLAKVKRDLGL